LAVTSVCISSYPIGCLDYKAANQIVQICKSHLFEKGIYVGLFQVAFVEWLDPLFVGGHWTPEMITMAGGIHPLNMPM